MSLETRTTPIWVSNGSSWWFPNGYTTTRGDDQMALANKVKKATGLPISYCYTPWEIAQAGICINFIGDNPPTGINNNNNTFKNYYPACVYVGLPSLSSSSGTPLQIAICSGGKTGTFGNYVFDTGITSSTSSASLRQNLAFIHHGNKTFIGVATDSMSAGGHLVFGALMDHARRRIIGLRNLTGGTTVDTLCTVTQSKAFNNDDIKLVDGSYVYEDAPVFTRSYFDLTAPKCSYNVVSMAPLVVPEEMTIVEDVFAPVYLRDDQDSQQFDISNSEYVSKYITSGCKTQGGIQYVVRMDSTEIPPNNQTS